jgi:hypothetical protein
VETNTVETQNDGKIQKLSYSLVTNVCVGADVEKTKRMLKFINGVQDKITT